MFNTKEKRERSLGTKLFLKGTRCASPKCVSVRRPTRPGAHGADRRRAPSEFGTQLQEKQRFQFSYGLRESQVKRLFKEALKNPSVTGDIFMSFLERRLDNVMFRLGFAPSRSVARQLVGHGHICVNGRRVTIPSYRVNVGDTISIRPESKEMGLFKNLSETLKKYEPPHWLAVDPEKREGKVLSMPKDFDIPFDVGIVVDYYSKVVK
jgi:small subunit ribosomal protein S4